MQTVRLEDRPSFITADGSSIRELAGIPAGNAVNQSLAEATVPPGGATIEHFHRTSEEIYLFTRGMGRMRLGDQESPVRAGDAIVIAPGTPHKLLNTGAGAARAALLLRPGLLARGHGPRGGLSVRALVLAALLALAVAAPASAASQKRQWPIPVIGIGEQSPAMFANPYFKALKVKHVRVITAWDSLRHRWSRSDLDHYMQAARAANVRVLLGFGHARSRKRKVRRYVPGVREFTREFLKYKKRYPWVKDWLTWNEANHCGEPTCHKPRRVARFFNNIRHNCYRCNVVAADVLDTPTMVPWVRKFRRTARDDKVIWGLHNYIDANRFRTTRHACAAEGRAARRDLVHGDRRAGRAPQRLADRLPRQQEARGEGDQAGVQAGPAEPARAADLLLPLAAGGGSAADVGLRAGRQARQAPRPAYKVLKRFVRRFARKAAARRVARERARPAPAPTPTPSPTLTPTPEPTP